MTFCYREHLPEANQSKWGRITGLKNLCNHMKPRSARVQCGIGRNLQGIPAGLHYSPRKKDLEILDSPKVSRDHRVVAPHPIFELPQLHQIVLSRCKIQ